MCDECRAGTQDGKGETFALAPEIVQMAECDAQHIGSAQRRDADDPAGDPARGDAAPWSSLWRARMLVGRVRGRAHRAVHSGKLAIDGRASDGFVFRHADGSPYGALGSPVRVETATKVFQALRQMGFKETEARRAVERARSNRGGTHVGGGMDVEVLLRAALAELGGRAMQVRDPARASYTVGKPAYRMLRDGARVAYERALIH